MEPVKLTRKRLLNLAADCANFSKLMDNNEGLALQYVKICCGLISHIIKDHSGRICHTADNALLVG